MLHDASEELGVAVEVEDFSLRLGEVVLPECGGEIVWRVELDLPAREVKSDSASDDGILFRTSGRSLSWRWKPGERGRRGEPRVDEGTVRCMLSAQSTEVDKLEAHLRRPCCSERAASRNRVRIRRKRGDSAFGSELTDDQQ